MTAPGEKSPFSVSPVIDAVLSLAVFTLFHRVLQPHVPSSDPCMIRFWAAYAAACLTGVFWLALQAGRIVYRSQRESIK
ncbi:MAG: hypothetical protein PHQ04_03435 [Opitutaceae bacterium]|nr:hypothetical protein [Opitutaceae bacterium]